MKTRIFLFVSTALVTSAVFSQNTIITLTFTGVDSATNVKLDSIKVMNRTQKCERTIYWPNKTLTLQYNTGISDLLNTNNGFQVFQNYPNPAVYQTIISLYVPKEDNVSIILTDLNGKMVIKSNRWLSQGFNSFRFTPGCENLYVFTAYWRGYSRSIKILQTATYISGPNSLEYIENEKSYPQLKANSEINAFLFNLGDTLLYIGYSEDSQTGILDTPDTTRNYNFQFAHNIPCLGTPSVEYEGQVYNTIQIFSQCWLKENLNVGSMILGSEEMTDNGIIEKYCIKNIPDNCTNYGGLYKWDEMMQYSTQQGTQGICPPDWHIPTDEEWKILEGTVDSLYGIGDPEWDVSWGFVGYNAGTNLKTISGWYAGGNGSDLFGFSGLPGGLFYSGWLNFGITGSWWTSTDKGESDTALNRQLTTTTPEVLIGIFGHSKENGCSIRCLMDP